MLISRPLLRFSLVLLPACACADQLVLTNGKTINGIVESDAHGQVRLRTPEGLVTLPRASISTIRKQSENDNTALQLADAAQRGELARVVALLARLDTASSSSVRDTILTHENALTISAGQHAAADVEAFAQWISRFPQPDATHLNLVLAQILARRVETERAARLLQSLPTAPLLQSADSRRRLAATLTACCEKLIESPHDDLTSRSFALLAAVQQDAPTTYTTTLLKLRASNNLAREHRWSEAIDILASSAPVLGALQVRQQLLSVLEQTQQAEDTTGTAAAGTAILNRFAAWFSSDDLLEIRRSTAIALAGCTRYIEAQAIADSASQADADKGAVLQHQVEFIQRRAAVDPGMPLQRYKLAVWARQMGLNDEAATIFSSLRSDPVIAENALLQLQLIEIDRGKKELERLNGLYAMQKLPEVQRGLDKFRVQFSDPELVRRASELEQLVKYAQWNHGKRLPDQADAALQNAQRLFNQGDLSQCIEQLNRILLDYKGYPAAKQAQTLLDKATLALALRKPR